MENFEYSKIYPFNVKDDISPDKDECMMEFIHRYEQDLKETPRYIHPLAPALFERTVAACEEIVREFGGKINAKIDYSFFTATIEMWCCYVEFKRGEFMSILHQISRDALSIRFEPLQTGEQHIFIMMPYFISSRNFEEDD